MTWKLQKINNGGMTTGPAAVQVPFASIYNSQQHIAYRDSSGNIWDSWYDPPRNAWNLQKINNGGNTAGPVAVEGPFVGVLHSQQHFTYIDNAGTLWDSWYDGPSSRWNLQKINTGGETSGPPARTGSWANWVSVWLDGSGEQQHFTYIGADEAIYDAFWDGAHWHLQKINSGGTTSGPPAASSPEACVYNNQQHISYADSAENIWDSWFNPQSSSWNLQKINNGGMTSGPASFPNTRPFVWVTGNQQHFSYLGADHAIYDPFWDGDGNSWHLQKINSGGVTNGPPSIGAPFASVYNGQQHIAYLDNAANIWDSWYDPGTNSWKLQKINNGGTTTGPGVTHGTCVWVWNAQQHFTYVDATGTIWDSWWDGYVPPVAVTVSSKAIVLSYNIDLGGPDSGSITGWANITLGPDGSYNYSGAIHNSNIADYNVAIVLAIAPESVPTVFSFGVQQSVGGYVNPFGSHDWNWGNSGNNGVVKDLWNGLVQGLRYWYKSSANLDLGATWNDVKTEIGYVKDVVTVVGALS